LLISTQLQDEQNILITISDNGTGIPEANRSRIFDPFFSTRPPGQGTGLGLSISHKIIEEHGGRIFFDCIDDVTVFSIVLPIERKGYNTSF
jgi:signal transduction histidine kinase